MQNQTSPASTSSTNNQAGGSEAPLQSKPQSGSRLRKPPVGTLAREVYEEGKALQSKYGWSNER